MSWKKYEQAAERGPIPIGLKIVMTIFFFVIVIGGLGIVGSALGWFSEAAQVASEEFAPRAALDKYEWFIDQAKAIDKMDEDIAIFRQRQTSVKDQYAGYGDDMSKWQPHIQAQYNKDLGQARDDLTAIVSQRNNLVREYNAASAKFNWSLFETKNNQPNQTYEELTG